MFFPSILPPEPVFVIQNLENDVLWNSACQSPRLFQKHFQIMLQIEYLLILAELTIMSGHALAMIPDHYIGQYTLAWTSTPAGTGAEYKFVSTFTVACVLTDRK